MATSRASDGPKLRSASIISPPSRPASEPADRASRGSPRYQITGPSCSLGPERAAHLRARCREIREWGELEAKPAPPFDANGELLPDEPAGPALGIERPARAAGLEMR